MVRISAIFWTWSHIFKGIAIYVYGLNEQIDSWYFSAAILDGVSVGHPQIPVTGVNELYSSLLYSAHGLKNGSHTLTLCPSVQYPIIVFGKFFKSA